MAAGMEQAQPRRLMVPQVLVLGLQVLGPGPGGLLPLLSGYPQGVP
tara:strand:- start:410 stop:547 length:138 start_codon:yes stop_codon:yes gene_type:complete